MHVLYGGFHLGVAQWPLCTLRSNESLCDCVFLCVSVCVCIKLRVVKINSTIERSQPFLYAI